MEEGYSVMDESPLKEVQGLETKSNEFSALSFSEDGRCVINGMKIAEYT